MRLPSESLMYQSPGEQNRRLVLRALRSHGSLSRSDLAGMAGLKGSTLTYVVRDLLERGILRTAGKPASRRIGPRKTLLAIDPAQGLMVGVELRRAEALVQLCDAAGQPVDHFRVAVPSRLDQVPEHLRQVLLERTGGAGRPLLGLGVGVPGVVNTAEGILVRSVALQVQNFPLRQLFQLAFDLPAVVVDHDAHCAALAESHAGVARGLTHFIYFLMGAAGGETTEAFRAFGAALFLEGRLYRGAHFGAGELENNLLPRPQTPLAASDWTLLGAPDAALSPALEQLAVEAGRSMAAMVALLDPQAVLVGNSHRIRNQFFIRCLQKEVLRRATPGAEREIQVCVSTLGEEAIALGAALAVSEAVDDFVVAQGGTGAPV